MNGVTPTATEISPVSTNSEDYLSFLPDETLIHIFTSLSLKDVLAVSCASKKFMQIASDNQLWKNLFCRYFSFEKPETDGLSHLSNKEQFNIYFKFSKKYPDILIESIGIPTLQMISSHKQGTLEEKEGVLNYKFSEKDVQVVCGTAEDGRQFIAFCMKNQKNLDSYRRPRTYEVTIYQKHANDFNTWVCSSAYSGVCSNKMDVEALVNATDWEYIGRLLRQEPCGVRLEGVEFQTTYSGKSAVHLIHPWELNQKPIDEFIL